MSTHHMAEFSSPTLSLGRYRLDWQVTRSIRLPDYAGSMLRGAFGHALRSIGCITREKDCTTCPLRRDCPYTILFEPVPPEHHPLQDFSRIPVPYIIEPPEWGTRVLHPGDTLSFHFTLIGCALQELPIAILAWRRALARGIGPDDGTAELTSIVLEQPDSSIRFIRRKTVRSNRTKPGLPARHRLLPLYGCISPPTAPAEQWRAAQGSDCH